ncbi:MAG: glycosyl hydrolase family 65 protein [Elusimicrobiota bacterium]
MKDRFAKHLSGKAWLIQESDAGKGERNVRETRLAQGNGYIGLRAILEETPPDACPGTYIAGLYDQTSAQVSELVNLPNPVHFKITTNGEKIGTAAMDVVSHRRTLDMRRGLLARRSVYLDSRKRRFDYQSLRFVSADNPNLIAFQVYLTPLDRAAEITVKTDIDESVSNQGTLTEGRKRHFQIAHVFQSRERDFLCVRTLQTQVFVAYANALICQTGKNRRVTGEHFFSLKLRKGETACFTKIICMGTSRERHAGPLERHVSGMLDASVEEGFDALLKRHVKAMEKLWRSADIALKGPAEVQKSLRFNIYHLLICGPRIGGEASIGAKTLSGEGYRGHIFWDADVFILPFFLYTQPLVAKNMLLYRYDRLPAARRNAKSQGYRGAQFPWESADTGEEMTPSWAKNFDGRIIRVRTGELEHHIVADIAFAVYSFYQATGDEDFMLRYGYEILFETARFWTSRVTYEKKRDLYHIRHVIGPDEFHEEVHDNAYTNWLAKWNLLEAYKTYLRLKNDRRFPVADLTRRINLREGEVKGWARIARRIAFNIQRDGLIEQFAGYFRKKRVRLPALNEHKLPDLPVGLDLADIGKTQFIKQADVVMLLHLLSGSFSEKVKKRNYHHYLGRTLHKSSLSPSVYATMGNEVGDCERAYELFLAALNADLRNVYGNIADGIHAASLGGIWQAVVHGFAGVRPANGGLSVDPRLPKDWRGIALTVKWRGAEVRLNVNHTQVGVRVEARQRGVRIPVSVYGVRRELAPNRRFIFKRPAKTSR